MPGFLCRLVGSSTMWLSVYTVSAIIVSGALCFACVIKTGIFAFLPFDEREVFAVFFWGLFPFERRLLRLLMCLDWLTKIVMLICWCSVATRKISLVFCLCFESCECVQFVSCIFWKISTDNNEAFCFSIVGYYLQQIKYIHKPLICEVLIVNIFK